jgi:hypothetical protein
MPRWAKAEVTGDRPVRQTVATSPRHPWRPDVMTYYVQVDLLVTAPPVWRRLEVASDVFLGDAHEIIQMAFGWTDSQLL